ncbi:putative peptidase M12B, ADAM/reprolysin, Disintegrin domain, Disintegrin domain superfamily [Septoria linicola]|nr:putative peptidase M12B, ADAM/reprolysin, Disintegrin domain, Disintegrin domain superfamily [Septoria linicola]
MRCQLPFSLLAYAATTLVTPLVDASSSIRNPIGALATIQNATIHTHNHRITALHEFDLTFNIRNELHVRFHLEPNHDILAEDATITYLAPDGTVSRRETVDRLGHKVFRGTAWVQRLGNEKDEWRHAGWARASIFKDGEHPIFQGAFSINRDNHHIQTSTGYMRTRHWDDPEIDLEPEEYMVLWRDSDIVADSQEHRELKRRSGAIAPVCQADSLVFNKRDDHPVYMAMKTKRSEERYGRTDFAHLFGKRQDIDGTTGGNSAGGNLVASIGNTAGCPTTRKVALLGVATDCTYTADFNSTETARRNVIDQINTASQIYESTFNISLGLQNLTVSDANCPGTPVAATEWNQACSSSVDISQRLNMFSSWRGNQRDSNAFWTLLSTCNTDSAVGLAWLGQACVGTAITTNGSVTGDGRSNSQGPETVTGANVVIRTQGAAEWQVFAHETGHTFGAVHDCTSSACADQNFVNSQQCCPLDSGTCPAGGRYIMNPQTSQGVDEFSPCSVGNICSALLRNSVNGGCLTDNRGVTTISGQQCGNGIVEPGEDCDCGGEAGCTNDPCCNPTTCKFTEGSVCDDSNEDCCRSCQFASAGTVCRSSTGQCDPEETCSGSSATCPEDKSLDDGTDCGSGLECASGQCTSRNEQCKTVMGSYTQGNDTYACDSSGCLISCASPEFGRGVCYSLQQNFIPGTPCGGGGRCATAGQCKGSTTGGQIKSWIDDNKAVVIGVASAVGGLILLAVLGCMCRCCKRRRPNKARAPAPPAGGWQGWHGPPPMQQQQQRGHPSQGWANQNSGQSGGWVPPPVPPPSYQGNQRGNSVRYA